MRVIILSVGLGFVGGAHASPRFVESCRRLAGVAAYEWADLEHEVHIHCLSAGVIPRVSFDEMVEGFSHECAGQLARRRDPARPHGEVRIRGDELTLLFIRHYDPVFKKYCANRNPGRGLVNGPARPPEA